MADANISCIVEDPDSYLVEVPPCLGSAANKIMCKKDLQTLSASSSVGSISISEEPFLGPSLPLSFPRAFDSSSSSSGSSRSRIISTYETPIDKLNSVFAQLELIISQFMRPVNCSGIVRKYTLVVAVRRVRILKIRLVAPKFACTYF